VILTGELVFYNKHVIVALIVAPVLSIIAYLGMDHFAAEKPHAARKNTSYALAAKSGCRYASGECLLQNGAVKIILKPAVFARNETGIQLLSSFPLDGAKVAVSTANEDGVPVAFESRDQEKLEWVTRLPVSNDDMAHLRLVVFKGETVFYAEVDTVFLHPADQAVQR
jgi:hypothetical protein